MKYIKPLVMKFGGSSVATVERIKNVAKIIVNQYKKYKYVVVVVSAPGDMTDELIDKAHQITKNPDKRELDMLLATGEQMSIALLSMAIKEMGYDAISLTGPQAGIFADDFHTKARIIDIDTRRIKRLLAERKIVIVAGFQGINSKEDITTLGRGGSDLTAVALAAKLKSDLCEIYTDVDGVYTTDPRIVPEAKKLKKITYDEMLEMAGSGAQVMQARSMEVAKKYKVKLEIKSSLVSVPGTIICS
jgi:aspartate kinase